MTRFWGHRGRRWVRVGGCLCEVTPEFEEARRAARWSRLRRALAPAWGALKAAGRAAWAVLKHF